MTIASAEQCDKLRTLNQHRKKRNPIFQIQFPMGPNGTERMVIPIRVTLVKS